MFLDDLLRPNRKRPRDRPTTINCSSRPTSLPVETDIARHSGSGLLGDFRMFLVTATVATIAGTLLIPTFQRYFSRAVEHFQENRSIPRLLLHVFSRGGINYVRGGARIQSAQNLTQLASGAGVSTKVIALTVTATFPNSLVALQTNLASRGSCE